MQTLISARWLLIVAAALCGAAFLIPIVYPASQYWNVRPEGAMLLLPFLQWAGTLGMSRHFAARGAAAKLAVQAGYVAAIAWGVALIGGLAAQASGPGGLVLGFLVVLPGAGIGLIAQIVALVGFVRADKPASA